MPDSNTEYLMTINIVYFKLSCTIMNSQHGFICTWIYTIAFTFIILFDEQSQEILLPNIFTKFIDFVFCFLLKGILKIKHFQRHDRGSELIASKLYMF